MSQNLEMTYNQISLAQKDSWVSRVLIQFELFSFPLGQASDQVLKELYHRSQIKTQQKQEEREEKKEEVKEQKKMHMFTLSGLETLQMTYALLENICNLKGKYANHLCFKVCVIFLLCRLLGAKNRLLTSLSGKIASRDDCQAISGEWSYPLSSQICPSLATS